VAVGTPSTIAGVGESRTGHYLNRSADRVSSMGR
jgi:hypothetical protein